jgi:xanthine dehydrogenase/oxidase
MPGVVAFISAQDIKAIGGTNDCGDFPGDEEIFASVNITHMAQPIGIIVADTRPHAQAAARAVVVNYQASSTPPITTIQEVLIFDLVLIWFCFLIFILIWFLCDINVSLDFPSGYPKQQLPC